MYYSQSLCTIKVMPNSVNSSNSVPPVQGEQLTNAAQNTGQVNSFSDSSRDILDILLEQHAISQSIYNEVKTKSASSGKSAEKILLELHLATEEKIVHAKAELLNTPFVSLATMAYSPEALNYVPQVVAQRFKLIPFAYDDKLKMLSIAMANPIDLEALQFVRLKTGLTIKPFAAIPSEVQTAIENEYNEELAGEVGKAVQETQDLDVRKTVDSKQIGELIKEAPIAKIVSTILEYGVTSRASDIHIEPLDDRVRVRYRIDGILYEKLNLPKSVQEAVISRIKILSEMKIDEHRTPQDGRFNFKVDDREVDLRISVLPTVFGEKIVMRLLLKSGGIPSLEELGLNGTSLLNLQTAMLRPHGIIIVCGPTGSGKTTTLYSVLNKLNTTRVNIMSLEDPVEYQMAGVNQVQINPAVGLTFASGLRAFLRQDPNIILVGEIRDGETAELATQAALTGHLVFSTLHTSNAAGALPRLIDLGAEPFLIASTVNALLGQRIVRKNCQHCRIGYKPPQQLVDEIKKELGPLFPSTLPEVILYKGKGCIECGDSGYFGRIGIYETLPITQKITQIILTHPDIAAVEKQAMDDGMITMKQDGYLKVLQGITTIEEVLRVAQE